MATPESIVDPAVAVTMKFVVLTAPSTPQTSSRFPVRLVVLVDRNTMPATDVAPTGPPASLLTACRDLNQNFLAARASNTPTGVPPAVATNAFDEIPLAPPPVWSRFP